MVSKVAQRKVRALLAGGLVLGVGLGATLAAWNDSEFAAGTFTAGAFNLEGSTTDASTGYAEHASAGAAGTLVFDLPDVAASLAPGDVIYAPFWVRLDSATTNDATLLPVEIAPGSGGNEANISYTITAIDAADPCDGTVTGTVVATGSSLSVLTGATSVVLTKGVPGTSAGAPVQLCFAVTGKPTLVQGEDATATWEFRASSTAN